MVGPSSLRRSIQVWEEQKLKVIILKWFNGQKNQCCRPMAQNLRISTKLLVILLSNLHHSHKKGNHFGKYAVCLSHTTLWVNRNVGHVCWGKNLDGRRQNPPEKIQLLDKVFSTVGGQVEFWFDSKFQGASRPISKHQLGDTCNTRPSLTSRYTISWHCRGYLDVDGFPDELVIPLLPSGAFLPVSDEPVGVNEECCSSRRLQIWSLAMVLMLRESCHWFLAVSIPRAVAISEVSSRGNVVSKMYAWNKKEMKCLKYKLSVILTASSGISAVFPDNRPPGWVPAPPSSGVKFWIGEQNSTQNT